MFLQGSKNLECTSGKLTFFILLATEARSPDTDTGFIAHYNLIAHSLLQNTELLFFISIQME